MKRRTTKSLEILLLLAVPFAAQQASAQPSVQAGTPGDSAKAAAVVARHVAAIGGEAALRSITQSHTVMTMSMSGAPGGAGEARHEIWVKSPALVYMKMNIPPIGLMEMGFDGKMAWSNSAATGPMIHDEVPKNVLEMANIGAPPLSGAHISYAGRREIGGRAFDAVKAILPDSQVGTFYFDVKTGLMSGMDPEGAPPPPAGRMTVAFDDYQRFGRVLQSTKLTTLVQGQEMVVRTLSVSHAPIDATLFDPPPAVRQLRGKPQPR
jgi:hypothetical protein